MERKLRFKRILFTRLPWAFRDAEALHKAEKKELLAKIGDLTMQIEALQIAALQKVIESAKAWQKRSWAKRAFHRWRVPGENQKKTNLFKKLERSNRKRRDYLYIKIAFKKKSHNKQRGLLNLAFHHSGKPRGWVRFLLFHRNREPRRLFRRIVCRKSGSPRKSFIKWLSQNKKNSRAHSLPLVQVGPISKKLIEHHEPAITFIHGVLLKVSPQIALNVYS